MSYKSQNPDGSFKRYALPNVFSKEQLIDLFNAIEQPKVAVATMLAYFCALRISEVINLKVIDIDFDQRKLKVVNGKMHKDRYVHIPKKIIPVLKKWITFIQDEPYLFPTKKKIKGHLSKRTLFSDYVHWLEKAGLKIPLNEDIRGNIRFKYCFHTLRHSRATHLHKSGLPITYVQKLLGHAFLDTTMVYTHISDVDLEKQLDDLDAKILSQASKPEERVQKIVVENTDPISMLRMRLAKGEINIEEFKTLKKTIELEINI